MIGVLTMILGASPAFAGRISVGTLNLWHYDKDYPARLDRLERQVRGPGTPEVMGFQEAFKYMNGDSLFEAFVKVTGFNREYRATNRLGVMNDGIGVASLQELEKSRPCVVVGDFNDTYDSEQFAELKSLGYQDVLGGQGATYDPANPYGDGSGPDQLDFIFYRPDQLNLISADYLFKANPVSDHYGISALLEDRSASRASP
jgi:hypothetical protein